MAPAAPAGTPLAPDIELSGPNIPDNIDGAWPSIDGNPCPTEDSSPTAEPACPNTPLSWLPIDPIAPPAEPLVDIAWVEPPAV
jgi:hypothetical protein